MSQKIILCGASSVGKTTLAQEWCNKHRNFHHIQEIARDIMKEKSITREDLEISLGTKKKEVFLQLQRNIFDQQNLCELALKDESFISDRGPDPLAYVESYYSAGQVYHLDGSPSVVACLERYRTTCLCVVLCPLSGVACDDGVRLVQTEEKQLEFNKNLCGILRKRNIPYIYMNVSNLQQRMKFLEQALNGTFPLQVDIVQCHGLHIPFHIPNQPTAQQQECVHLHQVEVTTENIITSFYYFTKGRTNRMVHRYGCDDLLLLSFHRKVSPQIVLWVLQCGLWVNGEEYRFLGSSSSGLKNRTCYMIRGSKERVTEVRNECGQFSKIKSVSKRLKRIGMLFSEVRPTNVVVQDENVIEVDDIESANGSVFTDGCGSVGLKIAREITERSSIYCELPDSYIPSVYQIRYQGCKGVIAVDTNMFDDQMKIRKSMKKFAPGCNPFPEIWLCDYSRPYSYGHLNRQFIMLLSGLGIQDEIFLRKQREHFNRLECLMDDPETAIEVLCWKDQPVTAAKIARFHSQEDFKADECVQRELALLKSRLTDKIEKLRILIPDSRNVFGVCDPVGVLQYGQCFIRPTIRGEPHTVTGKVTVGKNPCYLLGDIRVLNAIDMPCLNHLVDCLVFPTKGKQPHPTEIAGSDLDGDQYFVCWDKDLIPPEVREPYDYPSVEARESTDIKEEVMVDYFSQQNKVSSMMGKIDSYYKYWASREGVACSKCDELGKLFSRSVDATKTGDAVKVPCHLQSLKDDWQSGIRQSRGRILKVWEEMDSQAEVELRKLREEVANDLLIESNEVPVSEEFIWSLLEDDALSMSEFQIFQLVQRWCITQQLSDEMLKKKLTEFSNYINFGKFTTDQKLCAIDRGIPLQVVTNALNKSKVLTPEMLKSFQLSDLHSCWNVYFQTSSADFQWKNFLRAVLNYHESMMVLQLPDEIVFILHFLTPLQLGKSEVAPGSVVTYFFSPHFRYFMRKVLGKGYNITVNDQLIQLYRENETQTFLWVKSELISKSAPREIEFDRISVDLTTFKRDIIAQGRHPRINKQSFQCIEVFVKAIDQEKVYFDLYQADQPDDIFPMIELADLTDIEELTDEDDTTVSLDVVTGTQPYCYENALVALQQLSSAGAAPSFLKVLQEIISQSEDLASPVIVDCLLSLLTSLVTKYVHRDLPQDTAEALQLIIVSLQQHFKSPITCLKVLDRLCRLQCNELITSSLLKNIEIVEYNDYNECIRRWDLWSFLPRATAHQLAIHLYGECYKLIANQSISTSERCDLKDLIHIAESQDAEFVPDISQRRRYTHHFSYLLLGHFIEELANECSRKEKHSVIKLKAYSCENLQLGINDKEQTIGFHGGLATIPKSFRRGSYVFISLMKRPKQPDLSVHSVLSCPVGIGQVIHLSRHPTDIVVKVLEPVATCLKRSLELDRGHWQLTILGNVTVFKRAMEALAILSEENESRSKLTSILVHPAAYAEAGSSDVSLPLTSPKHTSSCENSFQDNPLSTLTLEAFQDEIEVSKCNSSQQSAIKAALTRRFTLIHGPPGTGKTFVACEIIRQVCQRNCEKETAGCTLVAAETNMAVDNLTRRLLAFGLRVVRIGGDSRVSFDLRHVTLEQQIESKRIELCKGKKNSPYPDIKLAKMILKAAQVVAVTCTGAGDSLLKDMHFQFVLIDEATQAIEPVCLIPIIHHCRQLTLIGDPQQLAPILPGSLCDFAAAFDGPPISELKVTLFHRLQKVLPCFFLDLQYRMHPALAEFPSCAFYGGKLKSAVTAIDREPPAYFPWPDSKSPLLFIDVAAREKRIGTSFQNEKEAETIADVTIKLIDSNVSPDNIVILSPYLGQVQCIREKVPKQIEVCTIDSFQGRENDIVIFSTVRCNDSGLVGFMDDAYRTNVLLTRAKYGIIGVGSKDTLRNGSSIWREWFEQVHSISSDSFNMQISKDLKTGASVKQNDSFRSTKVSSKAQQRSGRNRTQPYNTSHRMDTSSRRRQKQSRHVHEQYQ